MKTTQLKKYGMVLWLILACKSPNNKETKLESLPTVTVENVSDGPVSNNFYGTGMVANDAEIKLSFKTPGLIKNIFVEEGQSVRQGQILAEIDNVDIKTQEKLAELNVQKTKRDFKRTQNLNKDQAATETNVLDSKTAMEAASQQLNGLQYNAKFAKIFAPTSGVILKKLSQKSELISPFMPVLIMSKGALGENVKVGLSENDIVQVSISSHAKVSLEAYPNEMFEGKVTQINPIINPMTGNYEVKIAILNARGFKILPGFVAKIEMASSKKNSGISIPIEAIVEANDKKANVFIYQNNKVKSRSIIISKILGARVLVQSGLGAGEQIVIKGASFLIDGQKVKIANE